MTQVTVMKPGVAENADTPSARILREAAKEYSVTDERGRVLTLKKPDALAQYDLVSIVGGDDAKNDVYMSMLMPVLFLHAIDGEPIVRPSKKSELRALIQRLDESGIAAIVRGVQEHFGESVSQSDQLATVKK